MLQLKFAGDFVKLPRNWVGTRAKLVKIEPKRMSDLDPDFVEFDSRMTDGTHFAFDSKYDKVILLTFKHENGKEFTTIRSYEAGKLEYYLKNLNLMFTLVKT